MPNVLETRLQEKLGVSKAEAIRLGDRARQRLGAENVVWSKKLEKECAVIIEEEKQAKWGRKKILMQQRRDWRAQQRKLMLEGALDLTQMPKSCDSDCEAEDRYAPYLIDYKEKVTHCETKESDDEDTLSVVSDSSFLSLDEGDEENDHLDEFVSFVERLTRGRTVHMTVDGATSVPKEQCVSYKRNMELLRIRTGCGPFDYAKDFLGPISRSRWSSQVKVGSKGTSNTSEHSVRLTKPQRKTSDDYIEPVVLSQVAKSAPWRPMRAPSIEVSPIKNYLARKVPGSPLSRSHLGEALAIGRI